MTSQQMFLNICYEVQFVQSLGILLYFVFLAMPSIQVDALPQISTCCLVAGQLSAFLI